ncbi:sortase family protein [Clostridium perfringens D str. JGS1721]|uniref:Sortase family protein n=1 Tax=Clostridium perfringens D str. JGS1721 TaxID=488537 RepID=B1V544_CLOPF|nr:class D sortase [Clostridium perfringens]EDT71070.1 sortase family protein [Clostridium perfringens D str. JGS1721]
MRKSLIILCLIGIILVALSLTLDYKSEKIKNDLIESYKINSEEKEHKNEDNQIEQNIDTSNSNIEVNKRINSSINTKNENIIGILKISSINLEAPIMLGEENLNYVVAKYRNSPSFGESGNVILAGHNNMKGSIFRSLHKLKIGTIVEIQSDNKIYKYKITEREIVEPNDPRLLSQDLSKKEVTLITCTNHAKQRLILKGELI